MKDLEYFKKELIKILDKKEREEKAEIKKSLAFAMDMLIEKSSSGYPIGTIREWKGKKYQKIAPGKWRRKYSSEEKGIRMSIAALKKAIDKCATSQELLDLVLQNRDRFADDNGRPLPIVKELSEYASKKNDKLEKPKLTSNMEKVKDEVKHDGEYVLTKNGSKDFGEITPEIAKKIGRQAGKIRLRIGEQNGTKNDYGELHLERDARLKDLNSAGFTSARDFAEFVCSDYDAIYPNGMGLILYKKGKKHNQLYIQLTPVNGSDDFYDVKTGVASNREQMKNKTPLWVNPKSGVLTSEKESAHDNQSKNESPLRNLAGNPDNSNIAQNNTPVKQKMTYALDVRKSVVDLTNYAKENSINKSAFAKNKPLLVVEKSLYDEISKGFVNRSKLVPKQIQVRSKKGTIYTKTVYVNPNPQQTKKVIRHSNTEEENRRLDSEYFDAVEKGDVAKLQKMVKERAEKMGFKDAIPEQGNGYKIRTTRPPKNTKTVYKCFYVDTHGKPSALFVDNNASLPMNVWLNANDTYHFLAENDNKYVPTMGNSTNKDAGKTGISVKIPNESVKNELIERGYLPKGSSAKSVTCVAYRPGWHGGDLPFFPQGGKKDVNSNYGNVHRWNQVIFEIEIDADKDYTAEAQSQEKAKNKDGSLNYKKADLQYMPEGGFYQYTTNPTVKQQTGGKSDWFISGSIKIKRALTQSECNDILCAHGMKEQEWEGGEMDLSKLGYTKPDFDAARKTLAPITYDDDGKIIPLSQRFNKDVDDIRKSVKIVVKKSFADNFMNNRSIPALQKSIAVRGDFDAYKISDAELEEHSIFAKTEDGRKYDLQSPTEKFYYTLKKNLEKSLTWSGHKLQNRTSWNGLKISIENKKGSVRRGVDKDGHQWETKMHFDYGYIRGSEGTDGDHVDCYLGDNMDAKKVYIVHQNDPVTHKYDEDKCMLGFDTLEDAKKAYLMQYDRPGFLGKIDTMDFDEFKEFILLKRNHGKKIIKSYTDFVKSIGENFDFETMRKVCII